MTGDAAEADLVVINTCAVTEEAVRKSRQLVRRAHRANPAAKLVMSGCYASLDPEQAAAELGVDLVVPNPDKDRLVAIASETSRMRESDGKTRPIRRSSSATVSASVRAAAANISSVT